jgi:hypothetical protein
MPQKGKKNAEKRNYLAKGKKKMPFLGKVLPPL